MLSTEDARNRARKSLASVLPRRWKHVEKVAHRAETVRPRLHGGNQLVVACWLHDVGYAPALNEVGFHPLDGARAARRWGVDDTVCGLIAYHSSAAHEAEVLGLSDQLQSFTDPPGLGRVSEIGGSGCAML
ncbi:HD domain-containing protein [Pseudonocardia sp. McavD-2-B]|uniref:HD domain-containing protein n=1 Tax=Pseudonocardia sp. McavD-2-B TaxID=2954499 RepID=UPI0035ABB818